MQKVLNVIKVVFFYGHILISVSCFSQEKLHGHYTYLESLQENYDYLVFKKSGDFEYHRGASLGDDRFGSGTFRLDEEHLILNYNKTKLHDFSGYTRERFWKNNQDSIQLHLKIMDLESKPIRGANMILTALKAGEMADRDGYAQLSLKKSDSIYKLEISNINHQSLQLDIKGGLNYEIQVFLQKNLPGTPILGQIDTLKIIERTADSFKVMDKHGKTVLWKGKDN